MTRQPLNRTLELWVLGGLLIVLAGVILIHGWPCPPTAMEVHNLDTCESRSDWFAQLPPNEQGDAIAGVAGTLAFLGIVMAVIIQSRELNAQHETLKLTKEEMKGHKEAAEKMAEAMEAQLAFFRDEQRDRSQREMGEVLDQLLIQFLSMSEHLGDLVWVFADDGKESEHWGTGGRSIGFNPRIGRKEADRERRIAALCIGNLLEFQELSEALFSGKALLNKPKKIVGYALRDQLRRMTELNIRLSPGNTERLTTLGIYPLYAAIQYHLEHSPWDDPTETGE